MDKKTMDKVVSMVQKDRQILNTNGGVMHYGLVECCMIHWGNDVRGKDKITQIIRMFGRHNINRPSKTC